MNRSIVAILLIALIGASSIMVGFAYSAELTMDTIIESGDADYCTVSMSPSTVSIGGGSSTTHWISTDGAETPYKLIYTDENSRDGVVNMTITFDKVSIMGDKPILEVLLKKDGATVSSGSVMLTKDGNDIVTGSFDICGLGKLTSSVRDCYDVYLSIVTSTEGTVTINDGGSIRITANAYALGVSS